MIRLLLQACLCVLFVSAWCDTFLWAASTVVVDSAASPIDIPFDYQANFIYVTLKDAQLGPLHLLVDTGSEQTIIAKDVAERGNVHRSFWRTQYAVNGYGDSPVNQKYETVELALLFGTSQIYSGTAIALDLKSIKGNISQPVDGILGWDFFERWCATLNFAARNIALRGPQSCSPPVEQHATLNGEWTAHGLLLSSVVTFSNGESAKAFLHFDTGSDATLLLNANFRKAAGLAETGPPATTVRGVGLNGRYDADLVPVVRISVEHGKLNIDGRNSTTILIGRRGSSSTVHWWLVGPGEAKINHDGGIGNGLLEHMSWTFDPLAKRVYVVPNPEKSSVQEPPKAR